MCKGASERERATTPPPPPFFGDTFWPSRPLGQEVDGGLPAQNGSLPLRRGFTTTRLASWPAWAILAQVVPTPILAQVVPTPILAQVVPTQLATWSVWPVGQQFRHAGEAKVELAVCPAADAYASSDACADPGGLCGRFARVRPERGRCMLRGG